MRSEGTVRESVQALIPLLTLALVTAAWGAPPAPPGEAPSRLLLTDGYPLEVSVSFPAALLHWIDSLAQLDGVWGGTAGKTIEAHRRSYVKALGEPSAEDLHRLEGFRQARVAFVVGHPTDRNGLTHAFLQASSVEGAIERSSELLDTRDAAALAEAVRHFQGKYRRIWRDGEIVRNFLLQAQADGRRQALARFLGDVAAFYGVEPNLEPHPNLVLAPVRDGFGTHAQAIDHFLLLEVRPEEGLMDQVAPIVHENAHLLFSRMSRERSESLERAAAESGASGREAWQLLREALPTAIGQGAAGQRFRPGRWSPRDRWYHIAAVDVYAKRIYPIITDALAGGRVLDEPLVRRLVDAYPGASATPRAP